MDQVYRISAPNHKLTGKIDLDGSKSISNRVLIIKSLCADGFRISGLSTSKDTTTLQKMLASDDLELNAGHAGTSFRFMTALASVGDSTIVLTGSDRMQQRPIGKLVDALRSIGAHIHYLGKEGYPPLRIEPMDTSEVASKVIIDANVSSQYITALLLIAPTLPDGLAITLRGELVSKPYVEMTLALMQYFGVESEWQDETIKIRPQAYEAKDIHIEADWSAASYFYSLAALSTHAEILLSGLDQESLQADAQISSLSTPFGIESHWQQQYLKINASGIRSKEPLTIDFTTCPDIAQTLAVMSAGQGKNLVLKGLQTLVIKETDRIAALQQELAKVGVKMESLSGDDKKEPGYRRYQITGRIEFTGTPRFSTYEDHRMAMAFAPLALLHPIEIENPMVVKKSYPNFWNDLKKLGLMVEEV